MTLLKEAQHETAKAKVGIYGLAGSGKTRTAIEIAIGLSKDMGDSKPIAMWDSESGSDYMIPVCQKAGIRLLVAKTQAFSDLLEVMDEAQDTCSVLIVDSVTHAWQELQRSYLEKMKRRRLEIQDWSVLKTEWGRFRDKFLTSQTHTILCGRMGYEYEQEVDPDSGKKRMTKGAAKMKAEAELGHEPSLVLEMEAVTNDGRIEHHCTVVKDRTDRMDGQTVVNPTFASFAPVWDFLKPAGPHVAIDTSRTSTRLFGSPDWTGWRHTQQQITEEEIKEALILAGLDGTSQEAKKARTEILIQAFGTSAWTAISRLDPDLMREGLGKLREIVSGKASNATAP